MKEHPLPNTNLHKIKRYVLITKNKKTAIADNEKLITSTNIKRNNNISNKKIILSKTQIASLKKNIKNNEILRNKNTITNIKENSITQTFISPLGKKKVNKLGKSNLNKKNQYLYLLNCHSMNDGFKFNNTCFQFNKINENENTEEELFSSIEKKNSELETPRIMLNNIFNTSENQNNKKKIIRNLQNEKEFLQPKSCIKRLTSVISSINLGEKNIKYKNFIPPLKLKTNILNILNKKTNISSDDFSKIKRLTVNKTNLINSNLTERNSEKITIDDIRESSNKKFKSDKFNRNKLNISDKKINKQNSINNLIKRPPSFKKIDSKENICDSSYVLTNKKMATTCQTPRLNVKRNPSSNKKKNEHIDNTSPIHKNKISVIKAPKYKNKKTISNSKNNKDSSLIPKIPKRNTKISSNFAILDKKYNKTITNKILKIPRAKSQGNFGDKEDNKNINKNNSLNNKDNLNIVSNRILTENNINNDLTKGNVITTNLINIYSSNSKFNLNNNLYDIQNLNQFNNISTNNTNFINFDANLNYNTIDNNINNNIYNNINNDSASINIEDLIILQQILKDIMISLNSNKIICNECFEFWNYYFNSSINGKLENLFKNYFESNIIRKSINYELMSIMLCYVYSFELDILSKTNNILFKLLKLNYMNLMIICEHILNKITIESQNNIWVLKLKYIVNIFKFDSNEYNKVKNYNNMSLSDKINYNTNIIIQLLTFILQNFPSKKSQYLNFLFSNINEKTYQEINNFFRDNILQIENINGSILGSQFLQQNISFKTVPAPYVRTKNNKNFSLVLDLDETLINFKAQENISNGGLLRVRPGVNNFLEEVGKYYELILFTIATQNYADILIDNIEKDKIFFEHRLYREHAVIIDNDFVKDLSRIGRPLDKILIVDNMPQNFRLQKENGIMIRAFWGEDNNDRALNDLGPILVKIAKEGGDLRKGLFKYKDEIKILAY